MEQELVAAWRTITEVLLSCGVTPQVDAVTPQTDRRRATDFRDAVWLRSLYSCRRIRTGDQPLALVTAYLPPRRGPSRRAAYRAKRGHRNTYAMGAATGVRIAMCYPSKSIRRGPPDVADAVKSGGGRYWSSTAPATPMTAKPPLEVVVFHHRPERYQFSVTLPR